MAFRVDDRKRLVAFAGSDCRSIAIDGVETIFADRDLPGVAWAPVPPERRVPNGAVLQAMVQGEGTIRIPAIGLPESLRLAAEGPTPGSRGDTIECRHDGDTLVFTVTVRESSRWIYGVP